MTDYRVSHLNPSHAEQYARSFSDEATYRGMVWRLEKDILTKLVSEAQWCTQIDHLDFACGTGRVLAHLQPYVSRSTGVDVSPSMLELARSSTRGVELFEADLTADNVLSGRQFNLITAFRFFPNAQPSLRRQAMGVLADLLSDDGLLIFNNHRNLGSARYRLSRLAGRGGSEGMSMAEVRALTEEAGLQIIAMHHLGVIPASERRVLLPVPLLLPLEKRLSRISVLRGSAQEHIFVYRKL